jgi:hypothetical protein
MATHKHRERHVSVVPQKELYFSSPVCRSGHREVKVGIDSVPRFDVDIHATQNHRFRARSLQEPGEKEVVPQIEVRLNPHVGLAQDHIGRYVQDPRGGKVVQLQAIELQ